MRTLNLNEYGVKELTNSEVANIDGGVTGVEIIAWLAATVYLTKESYDLGEYIGSKIFQNMELLTPKYAHPQDCNIWHQVTN